MIRLLGRAMWPLGDVKLRSGDRLESLGGQQFQRVIDWQDGWIGLEHEVTW